MIKFEWLSPLTSLERVVMAAACDVHSAIDAIRADIRLYRQDTQRPWGIVQGEAVRRNNNQDPATMGKRLCMPWGIKVVFGETYNRAGLAIFSPEVELESFTFEFIGTPGYAIRDIRVGNSSQMVSSACDVLSGNIHTPVLIGNQVQIDVVRLF